MRETNQSCQNRGSSTGSWSGTGEAGEAGRKGAWISRAFAFRAHADARYANVYKAARCIPLFPHLSPLETRALRRRHRDPIDPLSFRRAVGRSVGRSVDRSIPRRRSEESRVSLRRMNKILFSFHAAKRPSCPNHRGAAEEFVKRERRWIKSRDSDRAIGKTNLSSLQVLDERSFRTEIRSRSLRDYPRRNSVNRCVSMATRSLPADPKTLHGARTLQGARR